MIIVHRESMRPIFEAFDDRPVFDNRQYFAVPARDWLEACNAASIVGGGVSFDKETMINRMERWKNVDI